VTSKADLANQALAAIGTRSSIADVDNEQSEEANQIRLQYDNALASVLGSAHWNFARAQVALTVLKDAAAGDTVPAPWAYEYAYPANCAQVRYIMPTLDYTPGVGVSPQATPVRFVVSLDADDNGNDQKVILTNQPQAIAVYTKLITNVALFDPLFNRAFAAYLGHLICMALTGDRTRAQYAFELANRASVAAQASNGDEGLTIIDSVPDWIRARGYEMDTGYAGGSMFVSSPVPLAFIS
jgi:hypothetical protein